MRIAITLLTALSVFAQTFQPGTAIEYKDGSSYPPTWERGVFVKMLPGGTQALIRKKPSQFFPEGSEAAFALADLRKPQDSSSPAPAQSPTRAAPPPPPPPSTTPQPSATALLTKDELLAYAKQAMGDNPWGNPRRDAILDQIRDHIKARGTNFQPDLDFSNRLHAIGTYSVHINSAIEANFGPAPSQRSYFGTWHLRAANRGSQSRTTEGGRAVIRTTDSQAESGQLTINPDGTYEWQPLRGQPTVLRGQWRWARPDEMNAWEGGPALWLIKAKQDTDYMVRADRQPGYADWIDVGAGKARTPVEYGRRP